MDPPRPDGRSERGQDGLERLLRESRNMFEMVLDAIPVRVFWKDLELQYLGCNRPFATDAGLRSPRDIVGKNDYDLAWRHEAELYRGDDRRVIESGQPKINYEEPQTTPDGGQIWLRTSKIPLRDAEGEIRGVLGCYEEITERKENELALRRYEGIVSAATDYIAFVDREGVFRAVNPACSAAAGTTPEEMVGKTIPDVVGRRIHARYVRPDFERCLGGEEVSTHTWIDLRDHQRIFVDVRYMPFRDPQGAVTGAVISIRDLTEWKNAEEERKNFESRMLHAQKLESLGVLAGGIAHDFNNLLTGILGNIGLVARTLPPDSQAPRFLDAAEKAAVRAADLCRQMLAYSGKGRFLVQPLNVSSVVEEMIHLLEVSVSKNAVLQLRPARDVPAVEADPVQIRQVVMNLITNASDAIGDRSGMITVTTGSLDCDRPYLAATDLGETLAEGTFVFLEVADTGCGMSAETRKRLFEPFFTTKFTGRGLGMAAVLGILRGHGGTIRVYSEPDRGTTIKVLLPASDRPALKLPASRFTAEDWRGEGTVLVADDEDTVRTLAASVLEQAGFEVLVARDGIEAVELFEKHSGAIDVVLLDLTMPRKGGEQVLRELREIRPDIRVILSSGYNEQEVTSRFARGGLSAFVQKPYRAADLLDRVRRVLEE